MIESREWCESFDEVESLVRMAGDYVQPSRDLRPRVLDAARLENGERRARRRIGRVAVFAALWGLFTIHTVDRLETPEAFRQLTLVAAGAHMFPEASAVCGDGGWALVDAYTELRRRQAEVLRL
jgi:hypothetical protein